MILSLGMIGAEASCAGFLGLGRSDRPAILRELSRAERLVDQILRKSPAPNARASGALTVRRSQLVQLRSELNAAEAVAASDLNTDVKVQTLRAYITRTERLAASLATSPPRAKKASERTLISSALESSTRLIITDRATLQQLKAQPDVADHLASSS